MGGSMSKKILIIALALVVSGCATTPIRNVSVPGMKIIDIPVKNQIASAEMGNTIIRKGRLFSYHALELLNEVTAGDGVMTYKMVVPAGVLTQLEEDNAWTYYHSDRFTLSSLTTGMTASSGGLKIAKSDPNNVMVFMGNQGGMLIDALKPNQKPNFVLKEVQATDKSSFEQELIYNGKSADKVRFLYREFTNNLLRGPFSQEVQYDLSESKIIGFKGCRIEILDATNTQLKYKVLESFPD